jgi:hypothetical protein
MLMLLGLCQLALVAGIGADAFTGGLIANAFGGGLEGAFLASQFGYGNPFNTYVTANALVDPTVNQNLLYYSALTPGSNRFDTTFNTYLAANALDASASNFFLAGSLGGASQYQLMSPYLANAFGGDFTGAAYANLFYPPPDARFGGRVRANTWGADYSCYMQGYWYPDCRWMM